MTRSVLAFLDSPFHFSSSCYFYAMLPNAASQQFWSVIDRLVLFSDAEKRVFEEHLKPKSLTRQEVLVDLGDVAKQAYFIIKGCVRFYYITEDGKEITGFVFTENMFTSAHTSFFNQLPSNQVLETIEPCEVLTLSFSALNELYQTVPNTNVLVRKIFQERFTYAQKVVESLISLKPEERYQNLLKERPDLVSRIPQNILATYLGITPVSLSRIRARRK